MFLPYYTILHLTFTTAIEYHDTCINFFTLTITHSGQPYILVTNLYSFHQYFDQIRISFLFVFPTVPNGLL